MTTRGNPQSVNLACLVTQFIDRSIRATFCRSTRMGKPYSSCCGGSSAHLSWRSPHGNLCTVLQGVLDTSPSSSSSSLRRRMLFSYPALVLGRELNPREDTTRQAASTTITRHSTLCCIQGGLEVIGQTIDFLF